MSELLTALALFIAYTIGGTLAFMAWVALVWIFYTLFSQRG